MRSFILPSILLFLVHSSASAQGLLQLELVTPTVGSTSTGSLDVQVKVTSTYQLEAVTAQVGTVSAPLQKNPATGAWAGSLELGSLPWGAQTLSVSARDVTGQTASVQRGFTLDRRPTLTLTQPAWEKAVSSTVNVAASCQDDDPGGCSGNLEVQVTRYPTADSSEPVLASGAQAVSTTLNLSSFDDGVWWVVVRLRAANSSTSTAFSARRIYLARPPRYQLAGEAPFPLIDFDADRFLATRDAEEFILQQRATGALEHQYTLSEGLPDRDLRVGALTPQGALFRGKDGRLYEWKGASLIDHGKKDSGASRSFIVQEPWVAIDGTLRNETTGQSWLPPYGILALSPRGEVASETPVRDSQGVYVFKEGAQRKVVETTYDASLNGYIRGMATDGYHFAWIEKALVRNDEVVYLSTGTTRTELTRGGNGFGQYQGHLLVNEGYVAYDKGPIDQQQVFLRGPDGVDMQLSFFSTPADAEALSPTGELILTSNGRRYLGRRQQTPFELGPAFGQLKFYQGEWYVLAGTGLFRVAFAAGERPSPGPVWTPPPGQWDTEEGTGEPDTGTQEPESPASHSCAVTDSAGPALLAWASILMVLALRRRA